MSADLFAEFGETAPPSQQQGPLNSERPKIQTSTTFSFFDDLASLNPAQAQAQPQPQPQTLNQTTGGDDDWGDFEGPSSSQLADQNHDRAVISSEYQASRTSTQPSYAAWEPAPIVKAKKSYDSNVLFDAEEEDDDDDFGDFEGPPSTSGPPPPPAAPAALVDLLGDLDISPSQPSGTRQKKELTSNVNGGLASKRQVQVFASTSDSKRTSAKSLPPTAKATDTWDSFDDWEASISTNQEKRTSTGFIQSPVLESSTPLAIPSATSDDPQPGELPPTNVPPPQLLLSLFPSLFAEAYEKLFKPMAAQALPMRNRLVSEPATVAYLQGYLALASVAAHIIAGRKLRWKRDVHLSQGMRIGPASSRATSGMKLTGIDRSENVKEEREVADVVRAWKEQIGRLRHVAAAVNQAKAGSLGAVPDLQETMAVRTLKQAEGGIPARQPCMLCGLKRDERVAAVDIEVEDSFGDWWVGQTNMHRSCRNFWREHKDKLRQR
jgi:hypothetical protein